MFGRVCAVQHILLLVFNPNVQIDHLSCAKGTQPCLSLVLNIQIVALLRAVFKISGFVCIIYRVNIKILQKPN